MEWLTLACQPAVSHLKRSRLCRRAVRSLHNNIDNCQIRAVYTCRQAWQKVSEEPQKDYCLPDLGLRCTYTAVLEMGYLYSRRSCSNSCCSLPSISDEIFPDSL